MGRPSRYSPEVRERAVRLVLEHEREHDSQWAAIRSIAAKIGCSSETLGQWVRAVEHDIGRRPGLTTDERQRLKTLERENRVLWRVNEILRKASAYCRTAGARPPTEVMVNFIDARRVGWGGEPSCAVLPIAPAPYHPHKARRADPTRLPARALRDGRLKPENRQVWTENRRVYGSRKVRRQLRREGSRLHDASSSG